MSNINNAVESAPAIKGKFIYKVIARSVACEHGRHYNRVIYEIYFAKYDKQRDLFYARQLVMSHKEGGFALNESSITLKELLEKFKSEYSEMMKNK